MASPHSMPRLPNFVTVTRSNGTEHQLSPAMAEVLLGSSLISAAESAAEDDANSHRSESGSPPPSDSRRSESGSPSPSDDDDDDDMSDDECEVEQYPSPSVDSGIDSASTMAAAASAAASAAAAAAAPVSTKEKRAKKGASTPKVAKTPASAGKARKNPPKTVSQIKEDMMARYTACVQGESGKSGNIFNAVDVYGKQADGFVAKMKKMAALVSKYAESFKEMAELHAEATRLRNGLITHIRNANAEAFLDRTDYSVDLEMATKLASTTQKAVNAVTAQQ